MVKTKVIYFSIVQFFMMKEIMKIFLRVFSTNHKDLGLLLVFGVFFYFENLFSSEILLTIFVTSSEASSLGVRTLSNQGFFSRILLLREALTLAGRNYTPTPMALPPRAMVYNGQGQNNGGTDFRQIFINGPTPIVPMDYPANPVERPWYADIYSFVGSLFSRFSSTTTSNSSTSSGSSTGGSGPKIITDFPSFNKFFFDPQRFLNLPVRQVVDPVNNNGFYIELNHPILMVFKGHTCLAYVVCNQLGPTSTFFIRTFTTDPVTVINKIVIPNELIGTHLECGGPHSKDPQYLRIGEFTHISKLNPYKPNFFYESINESTIDSAIQVTSPLVSVIDKLITTPGPDQQLAIIEFTNGNLEYFYPFII